MKTRKSVLRAAGFVAVTAFCSVQVPAQVNSGPGVVTVFDSKKVDESAVKALADGGSSLLWSHASGGKIYDVSLHSRESLKAACKPEGCSHKDYTAVVYVVSGAATLVVGGTGKSTAPDKFGGQSIQGGDSRRIKKGDIFIMPPDTIHWYKNVTRPFRYLEVPVP